MMRNPISPVPRSLLPGRGCSCGCLLPWRGWGAGNARAGCLSLGTMPEAKANEHIPLLPSSVIHSPPPPLLRCASVPLLRCSVLCFALLFAGQVMQPVTLASSATTERARTHAAPSHAHATADRTVAYGQQSVSTCVWVGDMRGQRVSGGGTFGLDRGTAQICAINRQEAKRIT